jgi:hypothetical protein
MTNRNGVAQNVAPRTTVATQFAGVIQTMRLGQKMSEDVSITDLIAEARDWVWCAMPPEDESKIINGLADALEAVTIPTESADRKALTAIRDAYEVAMEIRLSNDDDEFYCAIGEALNRVVDSDGNFSAVTVPTDDYCEAGHWLDGAMPKHKRGETCPAVPTENEREALSLIISNAVGGGNPNVRAITDVTDAVLAAGFRLPVPVEPEWEYRRRHNRGANSATFDTAPELNHGEWVERRMLGEWEALEPDEITEGGTQ